MEFHLLQMSIKAMCAAVRPTMTEYVKKYRVRINLHATVQLTYINPCFLTHSNKLI